MIKHSRFKEHFLSIVWAIGFLVSSFGILSDNSVITAFGIGSMFGIVGGMLYSTWIMDIYMQRLKTINDMIKRIENMIKEEKK